MDRDESAMEGRRSVSGKGDGMRRQRGVVDVADGSVDEGSHSHCAESRVWVCRVSVGPDTAETVAAKRISACGNMAAARMEGKRSLQYAQQGNSRKLITNRAWSDKVVTGDVTECDTGGNGMRAHTGDPHAHGTLQGCGGNACIRRSSRSRGKRG